MSVPPSKAPDAGEGLALQARLVAALRTALPGTDAGTPAHVIETHISWVLLTGRFAYKIKKAVGLPFLDFRTLAARHHFCEEELRLNRRFAPALYLDVLAITGSAGAPAIGGSGTAIEYAVRMREFPQAALASEALRRGEFGPAQVDALADEVAAAHRSAAAAPPGGRLGAPDRALADALENFAEIRPLLETDADRAQLDAVERWTRDEYAARAASFAHRREAGFVRECHGDLHLGNIALIDGVPTPFDCIEFNEGMRWIDVMSEIAFTTMDLRDRGRPDLAHRFLNRYLEITGDYGGLDVLRFHLVYRAMVRAKIARLRARQAAAPDARSDALNEYRGYLDLARHYVLPPHPALIVTHGLSGSGKTTLSQPLLELIGAVRIRTDVERARSQGAGRRAGVSAGIEAGPYSPEATRATYARVHALAGSALAAGHRVIVDAAFLKRWQREMFRELARQRRVPFVILSFVAPEPTLRQRIVERVRAGSDASEADVAVLLHQLRTREPLDRDEADDAVCYDSALPLAASGDPLHWQAVVERIARTATQR